MFDFGAFNKRNTVMDGVDTSVMEYKPLKDFCGEKVKCQGFFFTDGKYGRQVVVIGNGYLINMPSRAVEQFKAIENDTNALNAVLNGQLALTGIKMIDTRNGRTTAYTLANA